MSYYERFRQLRMQLTELQQEVLREAQRCVIETCRGRKVQSCHIGHGILEICIDGLISDAERQELEQRLYASTGFMSFGSSCLQTSRRGTASAASILSVAHLSAAQERQPAKSIRRRWGSRSDREGKSMSIVREAEMFARGAHAGQKHGDRPYWKHLQDTVDMLKRFGRSDEALLSAAWLHDTIEDTPVTYQDIKQIFGEDVAELVWCVTDELGRNRKERKDRTWVKIARNADAVVLKLADTSANILDAFKRHSKLCEMYRKEWSDIRHFFDRCLETHHLGYLSDTLNIIDKVIHEQEPLKDRDHYV